MENSQTETGVNWTNRSFCFARGTGAQMDQSVQEPVKHPARLEWHEVTKVAHYYLSVNAMLRPMQVREDSSPYGGKRS